MVTVHTHVLHGAWVIVSGGRLLYTHHGWLLGEDGRGLTSGIGGMVVAAPMVWPVCVCVCV